jgi:NitT/TauT family transport system permease protein
MRAFTASPWHVFRMVRLPHALPYVFAGWTSASCWP